MQACITLVEKKVQYDLLLAKKEDKPKDFQQLYKAIWPDPQAAAKVPTIIDTDGTQLTESQIVVEYIESKYKNSGTQLVPDDPTLAAKARLYGEFFAASFTSKLFKFLTTTAKAEASDAEAALFNGIGGIDAFLRTHGTGTPFLLGGQYSLAEALTASFLWRAKVILPAYRNIDLLDRAQSAGHQRFVSWAQAVLERPSTKETSVSEEVCIESFKPFVKEIVA